MKTIFNSMTILLTAALAGCTVPSAPSPTGADQSAAPAAKPAPKPKTPPKPLTRTQQVDKDAIGLGNAKKYDEAEKLVTDAFAKYTDLKSFETNELKRTLLNVCRWRDDFDRAWAIAKDRIRIQNGARKEALDLLVEYRRFDLIPEVWKMVGDECLELTWGTNPALTGLPAELREQYRSRAVAWIRDEKNKGEKRFNLAIDSGLFLRGGEEGRSIRAVFPRDAVYRGKDITYSKGFASDWRVPHKMRWMFMNSDFARFVDLYEYADLSVKSNLLKGDYRRAYMYALYALGRKADAIAYAKAMTEDATMTELDHARAAAFIALVEGRDADAVLKGYKLEKKDYAACVLMVGQWALNLQLNDAAKRYGALYESFTKPRPVREYPVKYFASVPDITHWRQVYDRLEKTWIDVPMTGDLDNLETDVATGRGEVEKTSGKTLIEVTSLCDESGFQIYLHVFAPNARDVERGFDGAKGGEMYFAPGEGRPYLCFGPDIRAQKVEFCFRTQYPNADYERCDIGVTSEFTDTDYVCRMFFPWKAFYQMLPEKKGDYFKFDCLDWGNKTSWGGSQGVHESSSWGHFVFDLAPAETAAIKRRLIYSIYKSWNRGARHGMVAPFDRWADNVVGDPAFYEECLKPLEEELKALSARVTKDMSDAETTEVYEKGYLRWRGLKHVIDALRRDYLFRKAVR